MRKGRRAALVVMALEVRNGHPKRLRARLVPDDTAASLVRFIKDVVEPGSTVITDGWPSYRSLPAAGYVHRRIVEGTGANFTNPVPHLHQAIGNFKAWLKATHHGVSRRHLAVYLDEFVFRHNRRLNLGAAFQTLLGLGTGRGPTTYDTIMGAKDLPQVVFTPSAKERAKTGNAPPVQREPPAADASAAQPASGRLDMRGGQGE
jgi:transposase-like protein